ncbi:barstar family protein [Nocardioides sp. YIM 152588]|uniref:barstar family protein n=1 Tax=Nocardioides sp. YIM 152588 TaxID=3158259 RepID=UPI0032E4D5D6
MTGRADVLADVLAGRVAAGVHRWAGGADADPCPAAREAGWRCATLDTAGVEDRAGLLAELGAALDFPAHYGRNLDALHDCLRDLAEPTVLVWRGWGTPALAEPRAFAGVVRVLGADRPGAALEVVLVGPGPADAAPLLG